MNTKFFCIFKRLITFILIFLILFNITNYAYASDLSTIGSLALDTVETISDSYKAEIIDFAKAAGYEANAQYISSKLGSNLCKAITNSLGSMIIAIITGANMGMRIAYDEMDYEFKKMFSYEECLQFIWKKAMGANDETLLRFLHTAMDPENVQGIADKSLSFKYDYDLSVAVANAVYDGYFEANPAYDSNIVMDYYGPNPFVYTKAYLKSDNYGRHYISDSYFEPEVYLKAIENYLRFNEPDFNIDFITISCDMFLKYGVNYGERKDYHKETTVTVYDFPDSYTPIFLYNPSTNSANLTVYEDPKYNETSYWSGGKYRSFFATDYPESDALFFDYGLYFRENSSNDYCDIHASDFKSYLGGYWYYIDDNGEQQSITFNLASFGHFCNVIGDKSIYKIPVYIMQDNILYPYDLKAERIINKPTMIYKPSIENALYNNMIPDNNGKVQNITVDNPNPYIDTNGNIVPVGEAVNIEPGDNPEPGGGNSGGSSDDFSDDAGSDGKFFFPKYPDFKGLLTIPDEAVSSFSKFAVFLSNSFSVLPDNLQSVFWWAFVFCLAVSLIVILL